MTNEKFITFDFGSLTLRAKLFDTPIALRLYDQLPNTISLQKWGDEVYGSIGEDLGEDNPISEIPPGGICYTNSGNYLCVFYGQTPAWPVEYIGQIEGTSWEQLKKQTTFSQVTIEKDN